MAVAAALWVALLLSERWCTEDNVVNYR